MKNPILKGKTIAYENHHNGILQDIKQTEPNSISFSCSSVINDNPNHQPKNILKYDNSIIFHSKDEPNSWLSIKLNAKKDFPFWLFTSSLW
jgi:hypothetical protein